MAESTLSIVWAELQAEVGFFLGWGRGAAYNDIAWSQQQQQSIDSCVKSGLRNFYFPMPADGRSSYDWSFLRPIATLQLSTNFETIDLPDDFGGIEGFLTITLPSNTLWFPIDITSEGRVRQQYSAAPQASGRPLMACVIPLKGTTGVAGQRFQLYFWPKADQAYNIQLTYYIAPDYLTGAFPYAYGGPTHAETILESCLAVAEKRLDDAATTHEMAFQQRLLASISMDRRLKPQLAGYNADRSDWRHWQRGDQHGWSPIYFNGILYNAGWLMPFLATTLAFGFGL